MNHLRDTHSFTSSAPITNIIVDGSTLTPLASLSRRARSLKGGFGGVNQNKLTI